MARESHNYNWLKIEFFPEKCSNTFSCHLLIVLYGKIDKNRSKKPKFFLFLLIFNTYKFRILSPLLLYLSICLATECKQTN